MIFVQVSVSSYPLSIFTKKLTFPMKNLFSLSLFLLFSLNNQAQTPVVALEKMNVMYMGVTNPVSIAVEGVEDNKLKVSIDNGSIVKNADGGYNVNTARTGLTIVSIEWQGGKAEKKFKVKPLPDPVAVVGNYGQDNLKADHDINLALMVIFKNFDFDCKASVAGFKLTRTSKNGESKQVNVQGAFNQDCFELIKNKKIGDTFIYSDIRCLCPGDALPRLLPDTIIRVIKY
jgi:GldM C-terminal domain